MGRFKRFCMIIFVLASVLGVGALAAQRFEWQPLLPTMEWLDGQSWYLVVECVLLGILALGLVIVLVRALTAPGKTARLTVKHDNGVVSITKDAIISTVKHTIESYPGLSADDIRIKITRKRDPRMAIRAKVDQGRNTNLGDIGLRLQDEVSYAIESFTSRPTESVDITFIGREKADTPSRQGVTLVNETGGSFNQAHSPVEHELDDVSAEQVGGSGESNEVADEVTANIADPAVSTKA